MSTPKNDKPAERAVTPQRATADPRHGKLLTSERIKADLASFHQSGGRIEVLGVPSTGKAAAPHAAPARVRSVRRGSSP